MKLGHFEAAWHGFRVVNEFGAPQMFTHRLEKMPSRFAASEEGGVTLETVLWIPFVFLLSIAIADTFLVYTTHASAQLALEDTTRQLVVGAIPDCPALEAQIGAAIQSSVPSAIPKCTFDPMTGEATVSVLLPAKDMGIGAVAGFIDNFELIASNTRTLEYFKGT